MRMLLERHVTRRSILRSIGCAGLALTAAGAKDKPSGKATAFALCGDESHNSDYIRSALTSTLTEDAGLSIDFTDEEKLLSYDSLRHYKILVMFRDGLRFPNGYWHQVYWNEKKNNVVSVPPIQKKIGEGRVGWMTAEQGRGIKKWVEEGGSLWAFHNNSQA